MKRLLVVCLLMLLSLILATNAIASPREKSERARDQVAMTQADAAVDRADVRNDARAADSPRAAATARKTPPARRGIAADQEIGDGKCFEYVLFGFWHVWVGCPPPATSGGGSAGGW